MSYGKKARQYSQLPTILRYISFVARALTDAPPNTLLGEAVLPVNPEERQTCINRKECILLACDVGIIWPFAHMRIAVAQRLILLADGAERVRRLFLISFRSVHSWLWSELMLK